MEKSVFEDVLEFMKIGHPEFVSNFPAVPPKEIASLCHGLIDEEILSELKPALREGNLAEIADGIADGIWVLIVAAHCYGLPIQEIWEEVRETNMAKFPGGKVIRRKSDGKIMKPEGWKPPQITRIVEERMELASKKRLVENLLSRSPVISILVDTSDTNEAVVPDGLVGPEPVRFDIGHDMSRAGLGRDLEVDDKGISGSLLISGLSEWCFFSWRSLLAVQSGQAVWQWQPGAPHVAEPPPSEPTPGLKLVE